MLNVRFYIDDVFKLTSPYNFFGICNLKFGICNNFILAEHKHKNYRLQISNIKININSTYQRIKNVLKSIIHLKLKFDYL